jgi:hypothetical protein
MSKFIPSRAMAVAAVALAVALGATNAYGAATNFLLNTSNASKSPTTLNGSAVAGKALQITNTKRGARRPRLASRLRAVTRRSR